MRAVIVANEGCYFKCLAENGDVLTLHRNELPEGVGIGDVLKVGFEIDTEATKRQKELMVERSGGAC